MEFLIELYENANERPVVEEELESIDQNSPVLYDLLIAGLNKLRRRENHHPPLCVPLEQGLFELRVGRKDTAITLTGTLIPRSGRRFGGPTEGGRQGGASVEDRKHGTNFDRYLERKLEDPEYRRRFEEAERAWDVALQLAALRRARGLTQGDVAERLGTRQQAIARLEDPAYTRHSLSMVRKYAGALGAVVDVTVVPAEDVEGYRRHRRPKPLLDRRTA